MSLRAYGVRPRQPLTTLLADFSVTLEFTASVGDGIRLLAQSLLAEMAFSSYAVYWCLHTESLFIAQ